MAFFNPRYGPVLSDPVNGKFRILSTRDGGRDCLGVTARALADETACRGW